MGLYVHNSVLCNYRHEGATQLELARLKKEEDEEGLGTDLAVWQLSGLIPA